MKIIAHRGASGEHPEQTRDAYLAAFAQRADGVECDIQLTADGIPVCLHDSTIDRTSNGTGLVKDKTLAELKELNFGTVARPQPMLTLAELLELVAEHQQEDYHPEVFVETKRLSTCAERRGQLEQAFQRDLMDANMAAGKRGELVHLISFDPGSLLRFRRINPHIHRVYLRKDYPGWSLLRRGEPAGVAQSAGFALARARAAPQVFAETASSTYIYTANRKADVLWAYRHGIGWLATDYPARAQQWTVGATRVVC